MKKYITYIIIAAIYNLLPAVCFIPAIRYDIGSFIIFLFLIYPITALVCALVHAIKHGFSFWIILFTAISFVPAMFIYFNSSAWVYMIPYIILSAIGNGIGALIHKRNSSI